MRSLSTLRGRAEGPKCPRVRDQSRRNYAMPLTLPSEQPCVASYIKASATVRCELHHNACKCQHKR
eukprot:3239387-Alexandrium_andersonii.AAC.1